MTVCNRCGKENQDHYKFCLGCGAELTAKPPGGDNMGMMKTMMADPGQAAPNAGAPLRGGMAPAPGPGPMRTPPSAMPGMPPPGPLGASQQMPPAMAAPMGPPPGVPGFSPGFSPPAAAAGIKRCPSCGSDVPATFRFCGTCGFRMGDEASAPNPMPMPVPQQQPPMQQQRARLSMTLIRPDGSE